MSDLEFFLLFVIERDGKVFSYYYLKENNAISLLLADDLHCYILRVCGQASMWVYTHTTLRAVILTSF